MNARNKNFLIGLIVVVMAIVFMNMVSSNRTAPREVIYSEFLRQVKLGQVMNVVVEPGAIQGEMVDGSPFSAYAPDDPGLIPLLRDYNVNITVNPDQGTPWYLSILLHWGPFLLIIGIWIYLMRRMQGGGNRLFNLGKSRARRLDEKDKRSTFDDVAGVEEAKEELVEIIEFLRDPAKFRKLGGKIPKGVLMVGPPGTGKTLLARAVAGEAEVPFYSISGSDFVEMFVGVGASRVRDLFDEGRKNAPCLLFIDEIDAVGRHRGAGLGSGHDEREQTLNQLLVEMDGFDSGEGVIVIAATNRPDVLDPALLRPGRFDRIVTVPLPDMRGRERILAIHGANVSLGPKVDLMRIAKGTPGFSGADLRNLINEAALFAARNDKNHVAESDLEWARDKVMMGPERKSMIMSDEEKRNSAYHEAGHALVGALTPQADPVHKVTIVPRGEALGVTVFMPKEDVHNYDREYLVARIMVAMGGRAAEELIFGEITTGAKDDIVKATKVARDMVCLYGMSEVLGPINLDHGERQHFLGRDIGLDRQFGENTAEMVDEEVAQLVKSAYEKAKTLLADHMDQLHRLAKRLIEVETVDYDELTDMLQSA
ncbi:MAG: ATP-dependent zinc metalloprotease FtsH [SAR324 cluster bacterium]|nr:ATP-dependent zinc metalloprotease FtsH [SAR324 cluster bacterium]